ncbi:MAG: right-handed parallel beta-helix repeat-containing protein, partial [Acidimicrobiales bacterium]
VTMSSDKVTAFDKNGITCDDPGTTCSISNTTVTGIGATALIAQNGIQVWGASATLSDDTVGACTYTGGYWDATAILVIDAGSFSLTGSKISGSDVGAYLLEDSAYSLQSGTSEGTWTVHDNTVKNDPNNGGGAPGDGFGDGIDVDSTASTTTVSNNTLKNDAGYGIGLYGAADVTVSHNTGTHDLDGLYIGGPGAVGATSSGDIVSANTFSSNSNDGILSDTTSTGNTFTGNMLKTNVDYDAQELGSGNTWTSNVCMPVHDENVGGLC